jgi:hypothetical protein
MIAEVGKSQRNWRQAFVEVALIGFGVLIALAVDSWWDAKQERQAEIEYLKSLKADFEGNRRELIRNIDTEKHLIGLGAEIHEHIASGFSDISVNELEDLVGDFFMLYGWEPITGTYDEMLGSGRLLYLQNGALRSKLSQYVHLLGIVKTVEQAEYMNWFVAQDPFLSKHLNFSGFGWIFDYRPEFPFDVDLTPLQSKKFHNLVSSWMVSHQDVVIYYERAIKSGDEILELINRELGEEPANKP